MVIAELSDRLLVRVYEEQFGAVVVHLCNGFKRVVTDHRTNLVEEFGRDFVLAVDGFTEFGSDFGTTFRAGNFDMPAIVISTGAAPQRDLRVGKAEILSVVVNRRQRVVASFCDSGYLIEAGEIWYRGGFIHGELGFDFKKRLWRHVHTFVGERNDKRRGIKPLHCLLGYLANSANVPTLAGP